MEICVFNILPAWLYCLITLIVAVYLYGIWPYLTSTINVPGPKPRAFVGNVVDIRKKGITKSDLDNGKTYGRVFLTWLGRVPHINITDPDIIKQILVKDFPNFTNRSLPLAMSRLQRAMLLFAEDDHWKFIRSIVTPAFSSGKMKGMVPLIHTCIDNLLHNLDEKCKSKKSFELKQVIGAFTLDVIGAIGFGIDTDVQKNPDDPFLKMARRQFEFSFLQSSSMIVSFLLPSLIPVLEAFNWTFDDQVSGQYFKTVLLKTIRERRANVSTRKDILQLLLDNNLSDLQESKADGDVDLDMLTMEKDLSRSHKLTEEEVMAQAVIFVLAGYETTSSLLSYLGYNFALNQKCQDKVIDEIDELLEGDRPTYNNVMGLPYLEMCMSESQRLHSIFPETNRMSRNATVIKGHYIPANTGIRFPVYALHHDPEFWPEPELFDPERFSATEKAKRNPYVFLPFGIGPRNCVGMRLAQLEAKMAIVAMLQKYRFVRSPDTEVPLKLKEDHFIHPVNGIWLALESRQ